MIIIFHALEEFAEVAFAEPTTATSLLSLLTIIW